MFELLRTISWRWLAGGLLLTSVLSAVLTWALSNWSFMASLVGNCAAWFLFGIYLFLLRDVLTSRHLDSHKEFGVTVNKAGNYVNRWEMRRLKSFIVASGPTGESENQIVLAIRFHWWQEVRKPQFWALVGMAAIVLLVAYYRYWDGQGGHRFNWFQVLLMEVIPLLALWIQSRVWASRYLLVTNLRCMVVRSAPLLIEPFMKRTTAQVDLRQLDVVNMRQSFWGRMLRYGTLVIDTRAQGDVTFNDLRYVPHIDEVREMIERARRTARGLN